MKKQMTLYYVSRAIISIAFGLLFFILGSPSWMAILNAGLVLAFFLWAPHSGRYSVHPKFGITALRRDERTQIVNDKAARNAFIVCMLVIGVSSIYFGTLGATNAPIGVFNLVLIAGALAYLVSDLWLRKSQ